MGPSNSNERTSRQKGTTNESRPKRRAKVLLPEIRYQKIDSFYSKSLNDNEVLAVDKYISCKEDYNFWRFLEGSRLKKSDLEIQDPVDEYVIFKKFAIPSGENSKNQLEAKLVEEVKKANIQINLYHPNIIAIKEIIFKNFPEITFVIEFPGESLNNKIAQATEEKNDIPETLIFFWMIQICLALKIIYDNKIIHRDLKPANIYVASNNIVKITNFSFAKKIENEFGKLYTRTGTAVYCAPEVFQDKGYDRSADIYSLGVILYELCSLKLPYKQVFSHQKQEEIIQTAIIDPLPDYYSTELRDIIDQMLIKDPTSRITLEKILDKPLIKQFIKPYIMNKRLKCDYGHDLTFCKELKDHSEKYKCNICNNSGTVIEGVYTCIPCKTQYCCCPFENRIEKIYLLKTNQYEKCFIDPEELIPNLEIFPPNMESLSLKQAFEYLVYKEHFIKKQFQLIINLMIIESKNQGLNKCNLNDERILKIVSQEDFWKKFQNDLNEQVDLIHLYLNLKQSEPLKTYFYNILGNYYYNLSFLSDNVQQKADYLSKALSSYKNSEKNITNEPIENLFNLKFFNDYFIFKYDILLKNNKEKELEIKDSEKKLSLVVKNLKATNSYIYQYTSLINEFQTNISQRKNGLVCSSPEKKP